MATSRDSWVRRDCSRSPARVAGKTRLALETASRRLDRFPDGVFFVDLSPLTDPTLVISAIAGVLKVQEAPGRDLAGGLRRHLADLDVLLVLDNLEQLVDGSSAVGDLDAAPGLTVLATSRIALRLSGEHEYQVAPLELPARERRGDAARSSRRNRCGCSSTVPRRSGRTSRSPMRTRWRSPRSSSGSTDCRSRWSSQRAGSACSTPRLGRATRGSAVDIAGRGSRPP